MYVYVLCENLPLRLLRFCPLHLRIDRAETCRSALGFPDGTAPAVLRPLGAPARDGHAPRRGGDSARGRGRVFRREPREIRCWRATAAPF